MSTPRYGYLGPEGTFTEAAFGRLAEAGAVEPVPMVNVGVALEELRAGTMAAALFPIENSVEGGVPATLDALDDDDGVRIVREVLVPVTLVLAARPGTRLADVRRVASHPHGWAQVRPWILAQLPGAEYVQTSSTAAAAAGLAAGAGADANGGGRYDAAVCAPVAAERYGLQVLAEGIGSGPHAVTRFVLIRAVAEPCPGAPAFPGWTGADKTSIVVDLPHNRSGALLSVLEQLSARDVNMSRIESRPIGDELGRYRFSIDLEGHVAEERIGEALLGLHRVCPRVHFLGSYPRASGTVAAVSAETSDEAFVEGRAWLRSLRQG